MLGATASISVRVRSPHSNIKNTTPAPLSCTAACPRGIVRWGPRWQESLDCPRWPAPSFPGLSAGIPRAQRNPGTRQFRAENRNAAESIRWTRPCQGDWRNGPPGTSDRSLEGGLWKGRPPDCPTAARCPREVCRDDRAKRPSGAAAPMMPGPAAPCSGAEGTRHVEHTESEKEQYEFLQGQAGIASHRNPRARPVSHSPPLGNVSWPGKAHAPLGSSRLLEPERVNGVKAGRHPGGVEAEDEPDADRHGHGGDHGADRGLRRPVQDDGHQV